MNCIALDDLKAINDWEAIYISNNNEPEGAVDLDIEPIKENSIYDNFVSITILIPK